MAFRPNVNDTLIIDNVAYRIAAHPGAPTIPYGQEGRQAVVYQLLSPDGPSALKVFKPRYRAPTLVSLSDRLQAFADLPALQVCRRTVLTPHRHTALLQEHPDLTYAVLMPWIEGPTWWTAALLPGPATGEPPSPARPVPPAPVSPTSARPTSIPPTSVRPTSIPPTAVPPTPIPPTQGPPTPVPRPLADLWVEKTEACLDECVRYRWSTQHASEVIVNGQGRPASGEDCYPMTEHKDTITLPARNAAGEERREHTVFCTPRLENVRAPGSVSRGQSFTVTWRVSCIGGGFHKINWWCNDGSCSGEASHGGGRGDFSQSINAPNSQTTVGFRIRVSTGVRTAETSGNVSVR
mgnify:CR=1 FL=1